MPDRVYGEYRLRCYLDSTDRTVYNLPEATRTHELTGLLPNSFYSLKLTIIYGNIHRQRKTHTFIFKTAEGKIYLDIILLLTITRRCFFCGSFLLFMFHLFLCYAVLSVPCNLVITCWERVSLLCCVIMCFVTFPYSVSVDSVKTRRFSAIHCTTFEKMSLKIVAS